MILVSFNSSTKGNNSRAGTDYPSRTPEITPGFLWGSYCAIFSCDIVASGVRIARSLVVILRLVGFVLLDL
jgi:hypothetical protein